MRTRILIFAVAVLVFGVAIAAYAYNRSISAADKAAVSCCCCSGDSCPMKIKGEATAVKASAETKSCCDDCSCCKAGAESCPMKMKGEKMAAVEGKHPESCPMMTGSAKSLDAKMAADEHHRTMGAEGKSCCGCSCCGRKDKAKTETAV
jgi:hypothetical protein